MGLYERYILPVALDFTMRNGYMARERHRVLEPVRGEVLEIGFGTGLNLEHYPPAVERLAVIDPADMLKRRVQARIDAAPFPIERHVLTAEALPFDAGRFDFVVSTWTLCTIPDATAALREVARVLKPGGRFIFLEHGRSDAPDVAAWQDRLNPIWMRLAGGCHLNRRIDAFVRDAGFTVSALDRFLLPKSVRTHGEMYRGTAIVER